MAGPSVSLGIDPRRAQSGARVVKGELDSVKAKARQTEAVMNGFGNNAGSAMRRASTGVNAFGAAVSSARLGVLALGVAVAAAMASGFQSARGLDAALAEASTLLEGTTAEMALMRREARAMASEFGGGTTAQVEAFYQAISAGAGTVEQAAELLNTANLLAKGGVTDITTSVDILTTAVNSYAATGLTAAEASDILFTGVKFGKTTVEELASTLGRAAPMAAKLGVEFSELVAATAALTKGGVSTAEAVTGVRGIMSAVLKPTKEAQVAAEALGLEFNASALASKGFVGFLQDVIDKTGGSTEAMAQLFGGMEGLSGVLGLATNGGADFNDAMAEMESSLGATQEAADKISESISDRLNVQLGKLSIAAEMLGTILLHTIVPVLEVVTGAFEGWAWVISNVYDALSSVFSVAGVDMDAMNEQARSMNEEMNNMAFFGEEVGRVYRDEVAESLRLAATEAEILAAIAAQTSFDNIMGNISDDIDSVSGVLNDFSEDMTAAGGVMEGVFGDASSEIQNTIADLRLAATANAAMNDNLDNMDQALDAIGDSQGIDELITNLASARAIAESIGGPVSEQIIAGLDQMALKAGVLSQVMDVVRGIMAEAVGLFGELPVAESDKTVDGDKPVTTPRSSGGGGGGGGGGMSQVDMLAASYENLRASLDPVYAAQQQLADGQALVNEALEAGNISADEATRVLDLLAEKYGEVGVAADSMAEKVASSIADNIGQGLMDLVSGTKTAAEAFKSMALSIAKELFDIIVVQQLVLALKRLMGFADGGAFLGGQVLANANGNMFAGGNVVPFASGGVVTAPTLFPMQSGVGLMGEAGPEAIMPLSRGSDGKLGVKSSNGGDAPTAGGDTTVINVLDPEIVGQYLNTANGRRVIMNIIGEEQAA